MICMNCQKVVQPTHWYKASGKPRCWQRFWTKSRHWKLMELWEQGLSDAEIAQQIGCSTDAVKIHRKRSRLVQTIEHRQVMTAREVQRRMGLSCAKRVTGWIERGELKGRQGKGAGLSRVWIVTEPQLRRFIADTRYWHNWDVEAIADADLRRFAEQHRQGERWLTLSEAASGFGVERDTVGQWITKGWLSARRRQMTGNHLVSNRDVERLAPTYQYGEGLKSAA